MDGDVGYGFQPFRQEDCRRLVCIGDVNTHGALGRQRSGHRPSYAARTDAEDLAASDLKSRLLPQCVQKAHGIGVVALETPVQLDHHGVAGTDGGTERIQLVQQRQYGDLVGLCHSKTRKGHGAAVQ